MDKTTSVDSVFKNRFSNLLEEKGLNQKEAAEKIGITRQAVNLYVSGKRTPDINTIYKICDYFHISSDYLLGLSDVQSVNIDIKAISEKTGLSDYSIEILEEYYLEAGTDQLIRTLNFLLENVPRFKINYFSEEEFKNIFEISKKDDLTKEEKTIFKNFKEKLIAGEEWEKSHFDLLSSIDKYLTRIIHQTMFT
jgi:transcriptional regulator with XRE-family HTH domain